MECPNERRSFANVDSNSAPTNKLQPLFEEDFDVFFNLNSERPKMDDEFIFPLFLKDLELDF